EEARIRLVLEQRLEADHRAVGEVVVDVPSVRRRRAPHRALDVLVKALHAELDVARDLLLDADRIVIRARGLEARRAEDRSGLLELWRHVEQAGTTLEGGAANRVLRIVVALDDVVTGDDARSEIGVAAVARVVEAHAGDHAPARGRLKLAFHVPTGAKR